MYEAKMSQEHTSHVGNKKIFSLHDLHKLEWNVTIEWIEITREALLETWKIFESTMQAHMANRAGNCVHILMFLFLSKYWLRPIACICFCCLLYCIVNDKANISFTNDVFLSFTRWKCVSHVIPDWLHFPMNLPSEALFDSTTHFHVKIQCFAKCINIMKLNFMLVAQWNAFKFHKVWNVCWIFLHSYLFCINFSKSLLKFSAYLTRSIILYQWK